MGVIRQYRKCQEIKNKEQDQYKEVVYTLNQELIATTAKLKVEKVKAGLAMELSSLCEQMDKAKADAMAKFWASQPFIDACGVYYGERFKDCLKQVGSVYPNLDLSKINLDDPVPTTLRGGDTINEESSDSIHTEEQDPKDNDIVIAQPVPVGLITPSVSSVEDPSTQNFVDPTTMEAPLS